MSGIARLLRMMARRDRMLLPLWIVAATVMPWGTYTSYTSLYSTEADRASLATSMDGAGGLMLLYGPPGDLTTAAGFTEWRIGSFLAILLGIFAILTIMRHTRAEEESGRAELLAAGALGRHASLTAALILVCGATLVAGLLAGAGLVVAGAPSGGSMVFGLTVGLFGCVCAGIAAIAAQLVSYARTANGIALAVLGVMFLLRGWGDAASIPFLSWTSPLGWVTRVQAFGDARWWVLALLFILSVLVTGCAYALAARRDFGAGLVASGEGPARGRISSPWALAWRLQRGALAAWALAFAVFGLVLGSLTSAITDMVGDSSKVKDMFEQLGGSGDTIALQYVATIVSILAVIAAFYGVQAALHTRVEEAEGRVEVVLATSVSRSTWLASHLVIAFVGSAALVVLGTFAACATASRSLDNLSFGDIVAAALVQLPALWVMVGLSAALVGLIPRLSPLSWLAAAAVVVIMMFGPLLGLSDALLDVSPFQHVPKLPGGEISAMPLLILAAVATVLTGVGFLGFRRRNVG
ncbi:exporter of polyketide antibiotics [soil metagenome]